MKRVAALVGVVAFSILSVGCKSNKPAEMSLALEQDAGISIAQREAELSGVAENYLEDLANSSSAGRSRVVSRKPYFYKTYAEYPEGTGQISTTVTERDSRTSPFLGEVRLAKVRYVTHLHRNRDVARDDTDYVRDTGVETLSFEYRNEEWHRIGSLFIAQRTEEFRGGVWVPMVEVSSRSTSVEQPRKSFWKRMQFWRD